MKFWILPTRRPRRIALTSCGMLLAGVLGFQDPWDSVAMAQSPSPSPSPSAPASSSSPATPGSGVRILGGTERSELKPIKASERWFDGVSLGFGTSYEILTNRTESRYRAPNLGMVLTYTEKIRGPWSGGVGLWLSGWNTRGDATAYFESLSPGADPSAGPSFERVAPVRIMSHVELAPVPIWEPDVARQPKWLRYVSPDVFFGLGFLGFLQSRGWPPDRADQLNSEFAVRYGTGLRFLWPQTIAAHLTWEQWRGVKTFDYTGQAITLTAEFGNLESE